MLLGAKNLLLTPKRGFFRCVFGVFDDLFALLFGQRVHFGPARQFVVSVAHLEIRSVTSIHDANVAKLQETAWIVWQCRSVFSHGGREITLPSADERLFDYLPAPDANETREILDDLAQSLTPKEQRLFTLMRQDLINTKAS